MIVTEIQQRVLYAHTDKMGVVYYGRYYEYFEAGRNDMLRQIGYPYTEMEAIGIALPVIESSAKYFSSATYDDVITIKTILKEVPTVKIRIEYELYLGDRLVVTGHTVHSFVKADTMKPTRPPERLLEIVKGRI
ncbi:MAG TPA: thioesterase family protein [Ignavibacteria bacterium]|nr:thioesterase family protein [Ignavibacteria bacterium]